MMGGVYKMDIVMLIIGGILIILGILNCFGFFGFLYGGGNVEADESHRRQYYCFLGAGTILTGVSLCLTGLLNLLLQMDLYLVLIVGVLASIGIIGYGQAKFGKKHL